MRPLKKPPAQQRGTAALSATIPRGLLVGLDGQSSCRSRPRRRPFSTESCRRGRRTRLSPLAQIKRGILQRGSSVGLWVRTSSGELVTEELVVGGGAFGRVLRRRRLKIQQDGHH